MDAVSTITQSFGQTWLPILTPSLSLSLSNAQCLPFPPSISIRS